MNKPYIYILDNDKDKNVLDVIQRKMHDLGTRNIVSYKKKFYFVEQTNTNDLYICLKHINRNEENKRIQWNFSYYVNKCKRKD